MNNEFPCASTTQITSLPSGLSVITEHLPSFRSIAFGIGYKIGSRDDPWGEEGSAHLIEHMIFKGTADMDAKKINIIAESNGAELNGFTDKELTCFYARCPAEKTEPVVDLLIKIVNEPAFMENELLKEKGVVAEEIRSNEEEPESSAINLLFTALYGETPLGKPVIGTLNSLNRISRSSLNHFYQSHYGDNCAVMVGVGDIEHEKITAILNRMNHRTGITPQRISNLKFAPRVLARQCKEISQAYIALARPTFSYKDPRRYALTILNCILGGGTSSRLFQRLREDEGLVYSISSFIELYEDTGIIGVYYITEHQKLSKCTNILKEEITRLKQQKITPEEFERAKIMTKSALLIGMESLSNRMLRLVRQYFLLGNVTDLEETVALYNRVTYDEVCDLIETLFNNELFCAGAVSPLSEKEVENCLI